MGLSVNPFFVIPATYSVVRFLWTVFDSINFVKKKLKKVARALLLSGNKTYLCRMEKISIESYCEMKRENVNFVVRWFQIVGPQPMARSVCRELMSDEHTMAVMCVSEENCEE